MNNYVIHGILTFILVLFTKQHTAQALYDVNTIQQIEITFTQADWDYQMDTAKNGAEEYLMAFDVKINGVSFDSAGVKYKGNSSFDSTKLKNPLHISLNEFKDQKYQGYSDIKLSNGYGDPSHIREVLSYQILGNYMNCPLSNFAQVYINGNYIGIYSSAENIDKKFCADHFYSSQNTFIKCNPIVNPGPTTKSNLKYINSDSSSYALYYEIKSKSGWNQLVTLCDSVCNNSSSLENVVDIDRIIWMLAFNNVLINLDSYSGVFAQNHYTYKDNTGHYNSIIWDLNMSFGAFPFAGAGGVSMGSLSIPMMQQFPLDNHATDTFWPLINAVQNNPEYKRKYVAHMRTITEEFFDNNAYITMAGQFRSQIDAAVQSDTHSFFSYSQFQNAMDSSVNNGSYSIPGIKTLMDLRIAYLLATPELSAISPAISGINASVASPIYNTNFFLNATITNANASGAWLGYRFDKTQKFQKVSMYDDGLHNDGASGDNVFGVSVNMQGGNMEYYIYAENNNAGKFSPSRAEHEFHILYAASQIPTAGQLVINELLAENTDNEKDEYNESDDWIELFNTSNQILNLTDVYLSDDLSNLTKWKLPSNTMVAPGSYVSIWSDDDSIQQILHTNFKLSKETGMVILSNGSVQILDSISFMNQTANISFGRYPNGTGSFIPMNTTFGYENNNYALNIPDVTSGETFIVYPNPAEEVISISQKTAQPIAIYTLQGVKVYEHLLSEKKVTVNVSDWASGMYFIRSGSSNTKLMIR